MIEEQVTVTKTDGTIAWVRANSSTSGCSSCASSGGCGISLLSGLWKNRAQTSFKAKNLVGAKAGDTAILEISETTFLKGAVYIYIVPILSLLVFSITIQLLFQPQTDLPVILAGIGGLLFSLVWLRLRQKSPLENQLPTLSRINSHPAAIISPLR